MPDDAVLQFGSPPSRGRHLFAVASVDALASRDDLNVGSEVLVVGEFAHGAYGPTLMLKLLSPQAAAWMRDAILVLVRTPGISRELASCPEVSLRNVSSLVLRHRATASETALRAINRTRHSLEFEWELDAAGWTSTAALLEPFTLGRRGHQYLTSEGVDDALVVASFGESEVRIAGS